MRGSKSRFVRNLSGRSCLVLASMTLALVAVELTFRLVVRPPRALLIKDPVVGQRYRPGRFEGYYVAEAGKTIDLRFNQDGYRGPDRPRPKRAGVRRIALLGDSFIAGIAVSEADTVVSLLADRLGQLSLDEEWESFNFGVSGNGTGQSLLAWRNVVREYAPDVVVLCFYNGNDLADNHPDISSAHRPSFQLDSEGELTFQPMSPTWTRLSRWLSENSVFYDWQKNKIRIIRDRLRQSLGVMPPGMRIFDGSPDPTFAESWRITGELIEQMAKEVSETGAEFLLVSIPCHEQLEDAAWRDLLAMAGEDASRFDRSMPETKLAEICQSRGIRLLSLLDAMRRETGEEPLFFEDRGHWTERGHRVAARVISNALSPARLHAE